ncbi:MAG: phosphatidate cytidylyltransferase, partial [Candidatus Paceibacterales bacterium]
LYYVHPSYILYLGALFWILPLWWVVSYQGEVPYLLKNKISKTVIGLFYLSFAWIALNILHQMPAGPVWIFVLFILVWSADTFAYFIGKKWGNKFLAPLVSPKKTQAGFWGGLLGAMLIASLLFLFKPDLSYLWFAIALITILLSILGDLFESLMKRLSGVKDSGKLLPGHGGVLDRIDSLLGALPFYALGLSVLMGNL